MVLVVALLMMLSMTSVAFPVAVWPPVLGSISPDCGPSSGGTLVTITLTAGLTGFNDTNVKVFFGSTPATGVSYRDDGYTVTAVSPPGTGTVDVTVQDPWGTTPITPADQFTYLENSAQVTSISPGCGSVGDLATIHGKNLSSITAVYFGTQKASIIDITAKKITVIVPPGSGRVNVSVVTASGPCGSPGQDYPQFKYK